MIEIIPVLSLVIALLAVIFGPLISLRIARRQVVSSLIVANKQIVAPMRQVWINNLRDQISEISSSALHYHLTGYEDREDNEYKRLAELEGKISLMLNFKEEDHKRLHDSIREMLSALYKGKEDDHAFVAVHPKVMVLARDILKREWDRVKEEIKET
jgi:hypothetical protein